MATQLDLQEQEQIDALKAFWNQYGNLITWTLVLVLGAFAAFNGWNWWQREQAAKAGAMFEELDRAAAQGDADKAARIFGDLRSSHGGTAYAAQGGLVAAKAQLERNQADAAKATLSWVADNAKEDEIRTIARLRLAAVHTDLKQLDEALKVLDAAKAPGFEALVADRRGDVLLAQGKPAEARAAYRMAYDGLSDKVDYRRLVEAKLTALGGMPAAAGTDAAASAAVAGK